MILKHIFFYFQQKKSQKVRGFKKHKAKVNLTYFLSHEENKGFTLIAVRSLKKKKKIDILTSQFHVRAKPCIKSVKIHQELRLVTSCQRLPR